jgi:hypothetical protein
MATGAVTVLDHVSRPEDHDLPGEPRTTPTRPSPRRGDPADAARANGTRRTYRSPARTPTPTGVMDEVWQGWCVRRHVRLQREFGEARCFTALPRPHHRAPSASAVSGRAEIQFFDYVWLP